MARDLIDAAVLNGMNAEPSLVEGAGIPGDNPLSGTCNTSEGCVPPTYHKLDGASSGCCLGDVEWSVGADYSIGDYSIGNPAMAVQASEYLEQAPAKIKKVRESIEEARTTIRESLSSAKGIIGDIGKLHVEIWNDIVSAVNSIGDFLGLADPPYKAWRPGLVALKDLASRRPELRGLIFFRSLDPAAQGNLGKSVEIAKVGYLSARQFFDLAYTRLAIKAAKDMRVPVTMTPVGLAFILHNGVRPKLLTPTEYNKLLGGFVALKRGKVPRKKRREDAEERDYREDAEAHKGQATVIVDNLDRVDLADLYQLSTALGAIRSWLPAGV